MKIINTVSHIFPIST